MFCLDGEAIPQELAERVKQLDEASHGLLRWTMLGVHPLHHLPLAEMNMLHFPLLGLKGSYHYWKHLKIVVFQGT